jgi:hypothetical protein
MSFEARNIMVLLGGLILAGVVLYFMFNALNRYGLAGQKGTAIVVGKTFQPMRRIDIPQNINGRTVWVKQFEPDTYLLKLRVEDGETEFKVGKDLFDAVNSRDEVRVTYTRLRLTGGLSVTGVMR